MQLDKKVPTEFQSVAYPDLVFRMAHLPRAEQVAIKDSLIGYDLEGKSAVLKSASSAYKMVMAQWIGWGQSANVNGPDGNPLKFDNRIIDSLYDMLPAEAQDELETVYGQGFYDEKAHKALQEAHDKAQAKLAKESGAEPTTELAKAS